MRRRAAVVVMAVLGLLGACTGRAPRPSSEPTTTLAPLVPTPPGGPGIPLQPLPLNLPAAPEPLPCGPFPPPTAAAVAVGEGGAVRWETALGGDGFTNTAPVLDTTTAFVTHAGRLQAVDLVTGVERWSADLGRDVRAMLLYGDTVIASAWTADDGGGVVALGRADGARRWEWRAPPGGAYTPAGAVFGDPVMADGIGLVVGTTVGTIVALDPASGELRWSAPGRERPRFVVTDGVVVRADGGDLTGLDGRTGDRRWSAGDSFEYGLPGLARDSVVTGVGIGTSSLTLRAFGAVDGRLRWEHQLDEPVHTSFATPAGVLVQAGWPTWEWRLLDSRTGAVRWRSEVTGGVSEAPIVTGTHILTLESPGDSRTQVAARRLSDGVVDWGVVFDGFSNRMVRRPAGGVLVSGGLIGPDLKGHVTAVDRGEVLWSATVSQPVSGGPAPLPGGGAVVHVVSPLHACPNVGSSAAVLPAS